MALQIPFLTVEPVVFFCMASSFLITVSLPQLLLDNICRRKFNNVTKCKAMEEGYFKNDYDKIQQDSAFWVSAYIGTVTAIILITLPTVGVISDVIGRRKALFLTPVSQIMQCLVLICIVGSSMQFPTGLLLLSGLVTAIVGDISGLYVFASSYITAITTVEKRTFRITLLDAAALLASVTATLSSGFLIERFGYIGIYIFIIALDVLAVLDLVFCVKSDGEFEKEGGRTSATAPAFQKNINSGNISKELPSPREGNELPEDLTVDQQPNSPEMDTPDLGSEKPAQVSKMETIKGMSPIIDDKTMQNTYMGFEEDFQTNARDEGKATVEDSSLSSTVKPAAKKAKKSEEHQQEQINTSNILQQANPVKSFKIMFHAIKSMKDVRLALAMMLVMGLTTIGYFGESSIAILYLKNHPFYFTAREVGFFLAYESTLVAIVGFLLFNWIIQKLLKLSDMVMLLSTSVICIPYQTLMGFAHSTAMLYSIQILHAGCSLNTATVRSILSKMASKSSVGATMGAIAMVETLAAMIGGIAIPVAYAGLLTVHHGAAFFLLSGIMLFAVGIITVCLFSRKNIYSFEESE